MVLYSRHNREKDEGLVARMVRDIRQLNPCPRWKLVVDIRPPGAGGTAVAASIDTTMLTITRVTLGSWYWPENRRIVGRRRGGHIRLHRSM